MAYVLGFFTADGCLTVNPRGSHYIEFVSTDRDVIEKIRRVMGSNRRIGTRVGKNLDWKRMYRIQIGSIGMFSDLTRIGFTPNKTKTVKLPDIPRKYFADYLRGYFDGDGCINYGSYHYHGRKKPKFHMLLRFVCKNEKFLLDLSRTIQSLIGTKGKTIFFHSGSHSLAYSTNDTIKILDYIYRSPTIFLKRKYKASRKALK